MRIKQDLKTIDGIISYNQINDSEAAKCVPDSVYLLLKWLFSDDDTFTDDDAVNVPSPDDDNYDDDGDSDNGNRQTVATKLNRKIINTGETIFFHTNHGRKHTPKHIGTALYVHQLSRSEALVDYLYAAGDYAYW